MKYVYMLCKYCNDIVERTHRKPSACCHECGRKRDNERSKAAREERKRLGIKRKTKKHPGGAVLSS